MDHSTITLWAALFEMHDHITAALYKEMLASRHPNHEGLHANNINFEQDNAPTITEKITIKRETRMN